MSAPEARPQPGAELLEVRDLTIGFPAGQGLLLAADRVNFSVAAGRTVGLVGESGCGKSVTLRSLLGLVPYPGEVLSGEIRWLGEDLRSASERRLAALRGTEISMIFQDPTACLNPVFTVGDQMIETLRKRAGLGRAAARKRAVELLDRARVPSPERRLDAYPHEMSGGMRQRVMIAIAISARPKLLLADEPTTALDVTTQEQILALLKEFQAEDGMAIVLVSHDLGVISETCDEVVVMYAGHLLEAGLRPGGDAPAAPPLHAGVDRGDALARGQRRAAAGPDPRPAAQPRGPAARLPVRAALRVQPPRVRLDPRRPRRRPRPTTARPAPSSRPPHDPGRAAARGLRPDQALLRQVLGIVEKLRRRPPAVLTALDEVDIEVRPGETLGVVGESGSGKSTLARCILRLHEPDAGSVTFDGEDVLAAEGAALRALRRSMQMVFQDPYTSLNPRIRVGAAVAEPARVHGLIERGEEDGYAAELLERVGIGRQSLERYPHEFSGGQRQRIAIARSLAVKPKLLIADEAVSALDVSIQAQLLSLLEEIRRDLGLTMIFIAHQLSVISRLADRVAIMYLGRIVETGATADVFANSAPSLHAGTAGSASAPRRDDGPQAGGSHR